VENKRQKVSESPKLWGANRSMILPTETAHRDIHSRV
jgi:hypothetical protein